MHACIQYRQLSILIQQKSQDSISNITYFRTGSLDYNKASSYSRYSAVFLSTSMTV